MFKDVCYFTLDVIRNIRLITFCFFIGSGLYCFVIQGIDFDRPVTKMSWLVNVFAWGLVVLGVVGVCVQMIDMMRGLKRREYMVTRSEQIKTKSELSNKEIMGGCIALGIVLLAMYFVGPYIPGLFGYTSPERYLQIEPIALNEPPKEACLSENHLGRLTVTKNGDLYLCTGLPQGWHQLAIQQ